MTDKHISLDAGNEAPAFTLPGDGGTEISLSDYAVKKFILYFYPRDDTSGCTKQAIGFTELSGDFEKADAVVVGVSADSVQSHDKFKAKHNLSIPLASDEQNGMLKDYGVWVEKSMYGRKFMGIERTTFLIDRDGTIAQVWRKVKVPGHMEAVLEAAQDLA